MDAVCLGIFASFLPLLSPLLRWRSRSLVFLLVPWRSDTSHCPLLPWRQSARLGGYSQRSWCSHILVQPRIGLIASYCVCFFGLVTMLPFMWSVLLLRATDYQFSTFYGAKLVLLVFVLVWCADSGAYFAGKKFGKHKNGTCGKPE